MNFNAEKIRILVVEDEVEIRELIALLLAREGHHVDAVGSVEEAADLIGEQRYDLLALDWMLPGASGVEMARSLRRKPGSDVAILMVTARTEAADIVEGLEAGADDYLTKPFEPNVLLARVRALLRRNRRGTVPEPSGELAATSSESVIRFGGLSIHQETYEVKCNGDAISLTASEFKLIGLRWVRNPRGPWA
jgi:two-component system phosphate regulon response regulator PhoB